MLEEIKKFGLQGSVECTVLLSSYGIIGRGITTNSIYVAQTIDNERNSNF